MQQDATAKKPWQKGFKMNKVTKIQLCLSAVGAIALLGCQIGGWPGTAADPAPGPTANPWPVLPLESRPNDGMVSVLAGSGEEGNKDGAGEAASFTFPTRIAINSRGIAFVVDSSSHRLRSITPDGKVTTVDLGYHTDGGVNVFEPFEVAVDPADNVYVKGIHWDPGVPTNWVVKITANGEVTSPAALRHPAPGGTVAEPGLAVDRKGRLYYGKDNDLLRQEPSGEVTVLAKDEGGSPICVALDSQDRVYFGDLSAVYRVSDTGAVSQVAAASFNTFTIRADGTIFGVDSIPSRIYCISPEASVSLFAGDPTQACNSYLDGRPVDPSAGPCIRFANGRGTAARFSSPYGIAIDRAGLLLVADTGNRRIRAIR